MHVSYLLQPRNGPDIKYFSVDKIAWNDGFLGLVMTSLSWEYIDDQL